MDRWSETISPHFTARHSDADAPGAIEVLELLEAQRERLEALLPRVPQHVAVVLHPSLAQLVLAQPALAGLRWATEASSRQLIVGWYGREDLHLLAPRLLAARESRVAGTRERLALAPAALYSQLACGAINPAFGPPFRPRAAGRTLRWAWLTAGSGAWLSGQTSHDGPAIERRLRTGTEPQFPPGLRDAQLLGGTVFDLVAREEGHAAAVRLAITPPESRARALTSAFRGRSLLHSSGAWRAHLARLAGA